MQSEEENDTVNKTFEELGLVEPLCEAAASLGWTKPSKIQAEAIPVALDGHDVIGLAETGSGKTGAFALPMLQALLDKPQVWSIANTFSSLSFFTFLHSAWKAKEYFVSFFWGLFTFWGYFYFNYSSILLLITL